MNNKINGINTKITPTIAIRSQAFFIRSLIGNVKNAYYLYKKPKDQNFTGIYTHSTRLRKGYAKGYAKGYDLTLSDTIKLHIDIYKLGNTILIDLHALNTGECKPQSKHRINHINGYKF